MATDDASPADSDAQPAFERIQAVRSVSDDVRQMQENLRNLQSQLRMLEWQLLEGRGMYDPERCQRLCDVTGGSMEYIAEDIEDLPSPYEYGDSSE